MYGYKLLVHRLFLVPLLHCIDQQWDNLVDEWINVYLQSFVVRVHMEKPVSEAGWSHPSTGMNLSVTRCCPQRGIIIYMCIYIYSLALLVTKMLWICSHSGYVSFRKNTFFLLQILQFWSAAFSKYSLCYSHCFAFYLWVPAVVKTARMTDSLTDFRF